MKFKNIKKNPPAGGKNKEFPSNSRSITESFKLSFPKINSAKFIKLYGGILKGFVVFIFIVAIIIVGCDFQNNLQTKKKVDLQREAIIYDLNFWENFIAKNQNYPDAYFQAAVLEYKLGNTSQVKIYVEKGLSYNPNSESGKKIEEFLKK